MVYRWFDVEYEGHTFTVQGDWIDTEPLKYQGFHEYDIITNDTSIHELLKSSVVVTLLTKAEEGLREMDK